MYFCEDCRKKKNWPDGTSESGKCQVCGKTGICHDVPAVMLVPEAERTLEQKLVLDFVQKGLRDKAEQIVIARLDGTVDNRLTDMVRKIFIHRHGEVDWYATYAARIKAQEGYLNSARTKRDRS